MGNRRNKLNKLPNINKNKYLSDLVDMALSLCLDEESIKKYRLEIEGIKKEDEIALENNNN